MLYDRPPGEPPENGRGSACPAEPQRWFQQADSDTPEVESKQPDSWIERYLHWLQRETVRLGGGQIARHYLACTQAAYAEYCASSNASARYRAWLAIRVCCQWLAQLEGVAT
jgi:hypothetical protein